jgi:hypothetical protein
MNFVELREREVRDTQLRPGPIGVLQPRRGTPPGAIMRKAEKS